MGYKFVRVVRHCVDKSVPIYAGNYASRLLTADSGLTTELYNYSCGRNR